MTVRSPASTTVGRQRPTGRGLAVAEHREQLERVRGTEAEAMHQTRRVVEPVAVGGGCAEARRQCRPDGFQNVRSPPSSIAAAHSRIARYAATTRSRAAGSVRATSRRSGRVGGQTVHHLGEQSALACVGADDQRTGCAVPSVNACNGATAGSRRPRRARTGVQPGCFREHFRTTQRPAALAEFGRGAASRARVASAGRRSPSSGRNCRATSAARVASPTRRARNSGRSRGRTAPRRGGRQQGRHRRAARGLPERVTLSGSPPTPAMLRWITAARRPGRGDRGWRRWDARASRTR